MDCSDAATARTGWACARPGERVRVRVGELGGWGGPSHHPAISPNPAPPRTPHCVHLHPCTSPQHAAHRGGWGCQRERRAPQAGPACRARAPCLAGGRPRVWAGGGEVWVKRGRGGRGGPPKCALLRLAPRWLSSPRRPLQRAVLCLWPLPPPPGTELLLDECTVQAAGARSNLGQRGRAGAHPALRGGGPIVPGTPAQHCPASPSVRECALSAGGVVSNRAAGPPFPPSKRHGQQRRRGLGARRLLWQAQRPLRL